MGHSMQQQPSFYLMSQRGIQSVPSYERRYGSMHAWCCLSHGIASIVQPDW